MKKILILGMSLNIGGVEKSLVNLLNMLDYSIYNVDLLLFQNKGIFYKQIPKEVSIIQIREITILYQSAIESLCLKNIKWYDLYLMMHRYIDSFIEAKKWKQFDQIRLHRWIDYYSKYIPKNLNKYDIAIAYAGGETAYYMFDKVCATRKIYFFHSDYSKINIDAELEKKYVNQADMIVTISDICRQSLIKLFPKKKESIIVLNNLSSAKLIQTLANEYYPSEFKHKNKTLKLVSIGRLNPIKGFNMAIKAASILKNKGIDFCWTLIGEGEERKSLEALIKEEKVSDCFFLVGAKENPYPYIKYSDLLVQTSYFEGKSVVLDEAKILKKPAIITNYNTASDQIKNGIDGIIVDMNADAIASGICKCVENSKLISNLSNNIIGQDFQNIDAYMNTLTGEIK